MLVWYHVWNLTMLRKMFHWPWDAICLRLGDKIEVISIVVQYWTQVPSIDAPWCPWSPHVTVSIGQGLSVPVIWAIEGFMCWDSWIDSGGTHQIECVLQLGVILTHNCRGKLLKVIASTGIKTSVNRGSAHKIVNFVFAPNIIFRVGSCIYICISHMSSLVEKFHPQPKIWGKSLQFSVFD